MTLPVLSYWAGERYKIHALSLAASCATHGHECRIVEMPDTGSWIRNCALKASVVHAFLRDIDEPFLFIDADAHVVAPLDPILKAHGDIGVHRFRGNWVCSGTILIRPTLAAREIVTRWRVLSDTNPEIWDSDHLEQAFSEIPATVGLLGPEWCWINGLSHRYYPSIEPKVVHLQRGEDIIGT